MSAWLTLFVSVCGSILLNLHLYTRALNYRPLVIVIQWTDLEEFSTSLCV